MMTDVSCGSKLPVWTYRRACPLSVAKQLYMLEKLT